LRFPPLIGIAWSAWSATATRPRRLPSGLGLFCWRARACALPRWLAAWARAL
jgi:hypothetical protein